MITQINKNDYPPLKLWRTGIDKKIKLKQYLAEKKKIVDAALKKYLTVKNEFPPLLYQAMRYSTLDGGKRLRPILVMLAAEACGGEDKQVLPTACALELIHTYSLIHDDLPAMDNDDYRRGKLTCHKKFGEAAAILTGDALVTASFGLIAKNAQTNGIHPERVLKVISLISRLAGIEGMIGGQVVDTLENSNYSQTKGKILEYIHRHKTAALIKASLQAGAILVGAKTNQVNALGRYGEKIGIAFQVADDILDIIGDKKKLGKKGSDRQNRKLTYPVVYGVEKSWQKAKLLIQGAKKDILLFRKKRYLLEQLADYIIEREY